MTRFFGNKDHKEHHKRVEGPHYICVTTKSGLDALVLEIKKASVIGIDTETDSLDSMQCKLVGISISWAKGKAAYIPIGHKSAPDGSQLPIELLRERLNPLISDAKKRVIAQNAKFDLKVLVRAGFTPFAVGGDPMLASYLLDADTARHNLDDLSRTYLHHSPITFEEVCGSGKEQITFDQVSIKTATQYAAEDADLVLQLANVLEPKLKDEGLDELYHKIELPTEEVLFDMEVAGVKVDCKHLSKMSIEFGHELNRLESKAFELAGQEFNLASPKQVSEILFGKLGLPTVKKTKTGYSTDSAVLEKLASEHELPKIMLEHRTLSKLKGTYIDALPKLINPNTNRIHTNFNQAITATGRLSSSDPNLQNIPARTKEGRRIREAFIAEDGNVLVSLDYSQVELRIMAHMSKDPVMLDSFNNGEDVHKRTASEIFNVAKEAVTREQRGFAKTINFGLIYGMGAHRLSQTLGISRSEASIYINRYYERYAGVYAWQKKLLQTARTEGEVRTLFGRRRKLPELSSNNRILVQRAERIAINTPIQGTAADLIKLAMIDANKMLKSEYHGARLLLQVHDELLIECHKSDAAELAKKVEHIMCFTKELSVPIAVESGIGKSWAEAH